MKGRGRTRRRLVALATLLACGAALSGLSSESITLTTSYPSPAGIYQGLVTTGGSVANPRHTVLARDAGRVGVGVTNPAQKLHVVAGGGGIRVTADPAMNQNVELLNFGSGFRLATTTTDPLWLGVNGTDVITINANQNVALKSGYSPGTPPPNGVLVGNLEVNDVWVRAVGKWMSQRPSCVRRFATTSIKIACGFRSNVSCQAGEVAIGGGMWGGGNDALQTSDPMVDAAGQTTGWHITVLDTHNGVGVCTNNGIPNGTVATGSPPNQGTMWGAAVAVCCKLP